MTEQNAKEAQENVINEVQSAVHTVSEAMMGIREQLHSTIIDLRTEGHTARLRSALENLQLVFALLDQITDELGTTPDPVNALDVAVNDGLFALEKSIAGTPDPRNVADVVETRLVPSLIGWDACEQALKALCGTAAAAAL